MATSAAEIVGTWEQPGFDYVRFYEDGKLHHAISVDSLDSDPYAINEFWFENNQMFLKELLLTTGEAPCAEVGAYEISLLDDGKIHLQSIDDKCKYRSVFMTGDYNPVQ